MRGTLYFEVSEFGTLVFAPAHCVDEVRGIRALVPTSRTWGDARSALSPERYEELVDLVSAPAEPPESVWPLAVDELTHPEPWIHYSVRSHPTQPTASNLLPRSPPW